MKRPGGDDGEKIEQVQYKVKDKRKRVQLSYRDPVFLTNLTLQFHLDGCGREIFKFMPPHVAPFSGSVRGEGSGRPQQNGQG